MRRISKTRQALIKKVKPIRDELRAEVSCCEICGTQHGVLDVHEIGRGPCRAICLGERCALLVVCRRCHDEKLSYASEWPEAKQLALLARRRPKDFSLADYLELTSPKAPKRIEIQEILAFMDEDYLSKRDIADKMQVDRRTVQNWIDSGQLPAIDARTAGTAKPLYRVAWSDYIEFCTTRRVRQG